MELKVIIFIHLFLFKILVDTSGLSDDIFYERLGRSAIEHHENISEQMNAHNSNYGLSQEEEEYSSRNFKITFQCRKNQKDLSPIVTDKVCVSLLKIENIFKCINRIGFVVL